MYGETQAEVRQKAALITADVTRGIYTNDEETDETTKLTTGEFLIDWLESLDSIKPNTKISYQGIVHNHLIPFLGHIKLEELEPIDVQKMLTRLNKSGLSARTRRYILTILRMALKKARVWRLMEANPTEGITAPRLTKYENTPLNAKQVKLLLTAAAQKDNQLHLALLLAISTGARAGELWAIEWDDIDFTDSTLKIRHTLDRRTKKLTSPKTETSIRTIVLTKIAINALRKFKEEQAQTTKWHDAYNLVFRTSIGTPLDHSHFIQRQFNPLLKSLQSEHTFPQIRFHDLRHTAATLLLKEGENIKVIAEMLGHKKTSMTADVSHIPLN